MKRKSISLMLIVILLFQLIFPVLTLTKVLAVEEDDEEVELSDTNNKKN